MEQHPDASPNGGETFQNDGNGRRERYGDWTSRLGVHWTAKHNLASLDMKLPKGGEVFLDTPESHWIPDPITDEEFTEFVSISEDLIEDLLATRDDPPPARDSHGALPKH